MTGFKATKMQRVYSTYLRWSTKLIIFLLHAHTRIANNGIEAHPCWAGGFDSDEGVVSQPCDVCRPFHYYSAAAYRARKTFEKEA